MEKSNYSVSLITLLIITITLSHYHNSPNRKCKLQIAPIFDNFTLLMAHCQCTEHYIFLLHLSIMVYIFLPQVWYYILYLFVFHHPMIWMQLFNSSSEFQKLSPEQYVILCWLNGNGCCTCVWRKESTVWGEKVAIYQGILQSQFMLL